jgi:hypothetical protein
MVSGFFRTTSQYIEKNFLIAPRYKENVGHLGHFSPRSTEVKKLRVIGPPPVFTSRVPIPMSGIDPSSFSLFPYPCILEPIFKCQCCETFLRAGNLTIIDLFFPAVCLERYQQVLLIELMVIAGWRHVFTDKLCERVRSQLPNIFYIGWCVTFIIFLQDWES